MTKQELALEVIERLKKEYPDAGVNLERQFQGSHCWDTTLVLLGF